MLTRSTALFIVGGALIGAIAGLMTQGAGTDTPGSKPDFLPILSAPPSVAAGLPATSAVPAARAAAARTDDSDVNGALGRGASVNAELAPEPSAAPAEGREATAAVAEPAVAAAEPSAAAVPAVQQLAADFPGWAPLSGPPTNKAELTRVLEQCGQRDGRACLASGIAYEKGLGTSVNASEADRFKRIALSYLARFCERRDAGACIVLAGMYRRGLVVALNVTQADSLEKRSRELCHAHSVAACAALDAK